MSELQIAEKKGDRVRAGELGGVCQEISNQITVMNSKRKD
jgi:hypothetical protein